MVFVAQQISAKTKSRVKYSCLRKVIVKCPVLFVGIKLHELDVDSECAYMVVIFRCKVKANKGVLSFDII
jgi:hypothetical protein